MKHELQNKNHCFELRQVKRVVVQGENIFHKLHETNATTKLNSNSFNILNLYMHLCQFLHTPMTVRGLSEWVNLQNSFEILPLL